MKLSSMLRSFSAYCWKTSHQAYKLIKFYTVYHCDNNSFLYIKYLSYINHVCLRKTNINT